MCQRNYRFLAAFLAAGFLAAFFAVFFAISSSSVEVCSAVTERSDSQALG
jgi:hypothetical protein